MKKTIAFILIAMMAITSVFAVGSGAAKVDNTVLETNSDATMELTLNLSEADVSAYRVGFASSNPYSNLSADSSKIDDGIPEEPLKTLALQYTAADSTASGAQSFVYYKFKTASNINITLGATELTGGEGGNVAYTVTIGSGQGTSPHKGASFKSGSENVLTVTPEQGVAIGTFPFTVKTDAINATQTGDKVATLTLTIAPAI